MLSKAAEGVKKDWAHSAGKPQAKQLTADDADITDGSISYPRHPRNPRFNFLLL